jgi:L-serine dehydratase
MVSVFELFKVGIGPSSSHTVGPMVAAKRFVDELESAGALARTARARVELYGSLAMTGHGHGTDRAVLLGLEGHAPASVPLEIAGAAVDRVQRERTLALAGARRIGFDFGTDLVFNRERRLPQHSNGLLFQAFDGQGGLLHEQTYFSVGGGFVVSAHEYGAGETATPAAALPHRYETAADLLDLGTRTGLTIAQMVFENELVRHGKDEIFIKLDSLWSVMDACIERGCRGTGQMPGRLAVRKRAGVLYEQLQARDARHAPDPLAAMDWVNLWAIAVNEENASGGRVVTAPTNGAAGIIPAVIKYYLTYCDAPTTAGLHDFFLAATAIGGLYKRNASISGAEVGCQGEVGVACSMAAAGLAAALGGNNAQVENAAEIGMEHNLGLTCDPIDGLVQIPCIERNAIGAVKAINASRMALLGDGSHVVSLDQVIATMRQTGADMKDKYKETALGGLAVNVVEC